MAVSDLPRTCRTAAENRIFRATIEDEEFQEDKITPKSSPTPTSSKFPPFFINQPNSVHADKTGLINGKLIYENSELATVLGEKMKALNAPEIGLDVKVEMMFFKNWGETQESLLLYAKPTEVHQVQTLVATAGREDIKVCINGLRTL